MTYHPHRKLKGYGNAARATTCQTRNHPSIWSLTWKVALCFLATVTMWCYWPPSCFYSDKVWTLECRGTLKRIRSESMLPLRVSSQSPINTTLMFLDCGRQLDTQRQPTQAWGEHAHSTWKGQNRTLDPTKAAKALQQNSFGRITNIDWKCRTETLHSPKLSLHLQSSTHNISKSSGLGV